MDLKKNIYFRRFLATYIDANIITIIAIGFLLIFNDIGEFLNDDLFRWNTKKIILFQLIFYFPYFIILEYFFKKTIGKYFFGFVIHCNSEGSFFWSICKKVFFKIIPYNWASFYFNKDKLFWHEKATSVFTIEKPPTRARMTDC